MNEQDRKTLSDLKDQLSVNCNFSNVLEYLKLLDVFTRKQLEHYESNAFNVMTEELKCQQLFTDIQTRGPKAFSILKECLKKTGHNTQFRALQRAGRVTDTPNPGPKVKMATSFPLSRDVYKMTSCPRGHYIFINNMEFTANDFRNGASNDENFTSVLEAMGYVGKCHTNVTRQQMHQLLKDFSTQEDHAHVDSLVVAISSHGNINDSRKLIIYGTDDANPSNTLLCDEIVSMFNSDECKLPKHQPKIFILQACRGSIDPIAGRIDMLPVVQPTLNSWKDTFILSPCFEGLTAYRNREDGSWLFKALTRVFAEHAHNEDLQRLSYLVNREFDRYSESEHRHQTLSFDCYGVTSKLYFNPGLYVKN